MDITLTATDFFIFITTYGDDCEGWHDRLISVLIVISGLINFPFNRGLVLPSKAAQQKKKKKRNANKYQYRPEKMTYIFKLYFTPKSYLKFNVD